MMQEVSIMTAIDSELTEQMSEDEILACLVAETRPVPTKKAKLKECRLQIMADEDEDPLDKYMKENHRLQQASLRLEQENDSLAFRLISSKITLRNALNKAEDNVEELTKDLVSTRRQLQATEEERRGKEEEAAMLKEILQRELEKNEQEVRRSSSIIADYKQICSQLTNRLERQQVAHREELESLKGAVKACSHCRHMVDGGGGEPVPPTEIQGLDTYSAGPTAAERRREEQEKLSLKAQIRGLEQALAKTKLQVVEAKCKIQDLEHQSGILANDLQEARNSWINKALTSLRTSSGGLPNLSMSRDGSPALGWSLQSSKKLSWPHRDNL